LNRSNTLQRRSSTSRGSALIGALVILVTLAGFAVAAMSVTMTHKGEVTSAAKQSRAFYLAEAGVSECLLTLSVCDTTGDPVPAALGSQAAPMTLRDGEYWCTLVQNVDLSYTVTSTGRTDGRTASVQAVVEPPVGGIWDHAIFAGNSSGDATYELKLGGSGGQADEIDGNVYSGNDVEVTGDASVTGDIHATGTISGLSGTEGKTHASPDIAGMDYANNNDYDVSAMFAVDGYSASNDLGGSALQMPEESPAHIFRLNPSDRTDETSATTKDDYFLEDPYEDTKGYGYPGGSGWGHRVTLSGSPGKPGEDGTNKVYYIDGNLWVHNKSVYAVKVKHTGPIGARITFVVKGNVYFSDDVDVVNKNVDGLAFIAVKDDLVPDSGNIYLGDPRYGTIQEMNSWLFAENNFYDNNLDAAGSKEVTLNGNMTAGNLVEIERDYTSGGVTEHSKLTINFDDRLSTGQITLPGLPGLQDTGDGWSVVLWRELGAN